jgi:hypothetical protein
MSLRFQFSIQQMVCVLHFFKKSNLMITNNYVSLLTDRMFVAPRLILGVSVDNKK